MRFDVSNWLSDDSLLRPSDASAAIILVDNNYLLQVRDKKKGIFYPGHLGFFGGGIESLESPQLCLIRELEEELGLLTTENELAYFTRLTFDFNFAGGPRKLHRDFFVLNLSREHVNDLVVNEGAGYRLTSAADALSSDLPIAPYDAYALWLHENKESFVFN